MDLATKISRNELEILRKNASVSNFGLTPDEIANYSGDVGVMETSLFGLFPTIIGMKAAAPQALAAV